MSALLYITGFATLFLFAVVMALVVKVCRLEQCVYRAGSRNTGAKRVTARTSRDFKILGVPRDDSEGPR